MEKRVEVADGVREGKGWVGLAVRCNGKEILPIDERNLGKHSNEKS